MTELSQADYTDAQRETVVGVTGPPRPQRELRLRATQSSRARHQGSHLPGVLGNVWRINPGPPRPHLSTALNGTAAGIKTSGACSRNGGGDPRDRY